METPGSPTPGRRRGSGSSRRGGCFALTVTLLAVSARADETEGAEDWKKLLDRPISPATVALLLPHADDPAVQERWTSALGHDTPEVRATTGRIANVTGAVFLLPALVDALVAETDEAAALEEIRAIAAIRGPEGDAALVAAVGRQAPRFAAALAATLARQRGAAARLHLPALREMGLDDDGLARFLRQMIEVEPGAINALASLALGESSSRLWETILAEARAGRSLGAPLIQASLTSPSPRVREATYWHLLVTGKRARGKVAAALAETPEGRGTETDPGSTFAFELLARQGGAAAASRPEWTDLLRRAGEDGGASELVRRAPALEELTKEEEAALSLALTGKPDAVEELKRAEPPPHITRDRPTKGESGDLEWDSVRLPGGYPRGLAEDLLEVTGCRKHDKEFGSAWVLYRPDGRPARVSPSPSSCPELVRTLAMMTLAPASRATEHSAVLVLPLARESLACLVDEPDDPQPASPPANTARPEKAPIGRIVEPKKTRHVNPVYPPDAKRIGRQGTVVLDSVISRTGCIREMEVAKGVDGLDFAAVTAVSQWRYTPTLLLGKPVPVFMTITINFRLN